MAGTLVESLLWARPTVFMAVPRIFEKFEEKLKEALVNAPAWLKEYGQANIIARNKREEPPLMYHLANKLYLKKLKASIGLD